MPDQRPGGSCLEEQLAIMEVGGYDPTWEEHLALIREVRLLRAALAEEHDCTAAYFHKPCESAGCRLLRPDRKLGEP